ncbi:hypothetical protein P9112_000843 [Eukaryota sp. TZLM1-RC]
MSMSAPPEFSKALNRLIQSTKTVLCNIERLSQHSPSLSDEVVTPRNIPQKLLESHLPDSPSQRIASNYTPSARHLSPVYTSLPKPNPSPIPLQPPPDYHVPTMTEHLIYKDQINSVLAAIDSTSITDTPFLPLHYFDPYETDPFTSASFPLPAHSKWYDNTTDSYSWKPCKVTSYDVTTQKYSLEWPNGSSKPNVNRANLLFDEEDKEEWERRWNEARKRRSSAEELIRFIIVADSLNDDLPDLGDKRIKNLNTLFEKINKSSFLIDKLKEEVEHSFTQSMKLASLSYKLKDDQFSIIYQGLKIPNQYLKPKPVPQKGLVTVPAYHFNSIREHLSSAALFARPDAANALRRYIPLLRLLEERPLVDLELQGLLLPIDLLSFQHRQEMHSTSARDYIIGDFCPKISGIVSQELEKSVAHLISLIKTGIPGKTPRNNISELINNDSGKVGALLKVLNFSVNDALKTMLLRSVGRISQFISRYLPSNEEYCSFDVNFKPEVLPLFKICLDCTFSDDTTPTKSPFFFVPSLDDVLQTVDSLFDSALSTVTLIPELSHQVLSALNLPEDHLPIEIFSCDVYDNERNALYQKLENYLKGISVFLDQFKSFEEYLIQTPQQYLINFYKSCIKQEDAEEEETSQDENLDDDSDTQEELNEEEEEVRIVQIDDVDFGLIDIDTLSNEISRHDDAFRRISFDFVSVVKFDLLLVDCQRVQQIIMEKAQEFSSALRSKIAQSLFNSCKSVIHQYTEIESKLQESPENPEELHELRLFIANLPNTEAEIGNTITQIKSQINLLDSFFHPHSDETISLYTEILGWSRRVSDCLVEQELRLDQTRVLMITELEQLRDQVSDEISSISDSIDDLQHEGDVGSAPDLEDRVNGLKEQLSALAEKIRLVNSRESLFDMDNTCFSLFSEIEKTFEEYYLLWTTAAAIGKQIPLWLNDVFTSLDPNVITDTVQQWNKSLVKRLRTFKEVPMPNQVVTSLRDRLAEFKSAIEVVQALRAPGLKARHWDKRISTVVGIPIRPTPDLRLQDLIDLGVHQHISDLQEIAAVAGREFNIEHNLDKMSKEWVSTEFDIKPHESKTFILRGTDDVVGILDEQIINVQTIRGSPFIKPFEDRARAFETELHLVQDTIEQWLLVQKAWMYLEPIFCSEDIVRQLPDESTRFSKVDSLWRSVMERVSKGPNVFNICNDEALLQSFTEANESLEIIQKGLSDYLETKRQAFPRFYFLSNDGLLEILSETKDPKKVNPHLRSCFEAIDKLEFSEDNSGITAMYSAEGEKVLFDQTVNPTTLIEKWLTEVETVMRSSLRKVVNDALVDYSKTPRSKWVLKWPSQVVLAISQIEWTRGVTEAMINNGVDGLVEFKKQLDQQLNEIILLVRGGLKESERITISALIVIDVHNRDIVAKMANEGVSSPDDFLWLSQLRYYYEQSTILIKQVTATVEYGYEYLGNTGRLVITPLTDKCYVTLMSAMQLYLGGAPAGPAGTGKTETVKDLAKALAKQCVVYNCSDSLDHLAMAKFFKGLVSSGAWACFDEFNRINLEVLSVVAQQILTIQSAIKAHSAVIDFEGSRIKVNPNCAVFITMNPGYAGRTELPDNLKALFRSVAMMVPDYSLISEIVLMSFGYFEARLLAQKLVHTFQLGSQQLSSQDHYDFGMRAVKTVLTAAGALKKAFPDQDEDILIYRALCDVNLPKFLEQDVSLFLGIITDLFPKTKLPDPDYDLLLSSINDVIADLKLQPHPEFIKKVVQLYETVMVRHGLMTVGLPMSGKSCIVKVLGEAMTRLVGKSENFTTVHRHYLNPKAVTIGQLYGYRDELSQEVVDGLVGVLVRNASRDRSRDRHWIIFDGPVDAVWIESMNTVLDDNKKLCLPSGDIIQLTPHMTMMFEVADLAVASPATVSRCGMVYCELSVLGWRPLFDSWMDQFPQALEDQKELILKFVDFFIDDCAEFVRKNVKEPVATSPQILVRSFTNIINSLIAEYLASPDQIEKLGSRNLNISMEAVLIFSLVWSFGATGLLQDRKDFNAFINEKLGSKEYKVACPLPRNQSFYDVCWNFDQADWIDWYQTVPEFSIPTGTPFHEIIVDTVDTIRSSYLLEILIKSKVPVLFTGPTGTSKTVVMKKVLHEVLDKDKYLPSSLGFSARTDCNQVQDIVDSKIDQKRRKDVYGPPLGHNAVIFVDDLNMPKKEIYGAQPPIELLRQWMDYSGWYDRKQLVFRKLVDIQFVSAMGHPGGGRSEITQRFTRHCNLISFTSLNSETLTRIFSKIFSWFTDGFSSEIRNLSSSIVESSVYLYNSISENLLPTPSKSHYTFNLRDVSKVFQGIMQGSTTTIKSGVDLVSLWVHEASRVFKDRLVDDSDRKWFDSIIDTTLKEKFRGVDLSELEESSSLFGSVLNPSSDPIVYEKLPELTQLRSVIGDFLEDFNSTTQNPMQLVLFEYCLTHVLRVSRILNQPFGHALLVGVGGSGRQSVARLASFVCDLELFEVEVSRNFGVNEWREFVKGLMKNSGFADKPTVLLLSDTKITNEAFLEDVNNLLNSGEVPNLFIQEEINEIIEGLGEEAQKQGKSVDRQSVWNWFIDRCRRNLHVILCLSPVGDSFRDRLRMFPSLVNCCTIDVFASWPEEALRSVASEFLQDVDLAPEVYEKAVKFTVSVHSSIEKQAEKFFSEYKRKVFVTPTFFLELINTLKSLYHQQTESISSQIDRYTTGLGQLSSTSEQVKEMQVELTELKPKLVTAAKETDDLMTRITADQAVADEKKQQLEVETAEVEKLVKEAETTESECNAALEVALPALHSAVKALQNLNKGDVVEIRSMRNPPKPVRLVLEAICIMKQVKPVRKPGTKEKDYWEPSTKMLANVTEFFNSLYQYDFDNIPSSVISNIVPYINSPDFHVKVITQASVPAGALCEWVHAVYKYHVVVEEIAPKKKALEEARKQLATLQKELQAKRNNLDEILASIDKLTENYNDAVSRKKELEDRYDTCNKQLERAVKLLDGLKDEKVNWSSSLGKLKALFENIVGDLLLSSAAIVYLGPFNQIFRDRIMQSWIELLSELEVAMTENFSLSNCIGDPVLIRSWNINKLPPNKFSVDNGIIASNSMKFPLFIDPQGQAARWIKLMEGSNGLVVAKPTDSDLIKVLERAVQFGKPVLIENFGNEIDPGLDPLLLKQIFTSGGMLHIQLGDTVPYDENFKLYMTTKLANPIYPPEIAAKVCLINFCITPTGLEDQLLSTVVQSWEPSLEEQKGELILQKAKYAAEQDELETKILNLLVRAEGNILDDDVLIETLGQSKITVKKIEDDMKVAKQTELQIDKKRELFEPIARSVSVLFFCISDLSLIAPMYQYSLDWFINLFKNALEKAPESVDGVKVPDLLVLRGSGEKKRKGLTVVEKRLTSLNHYFTNSLFLNVCRGLFSGDKLLFSLLLCSRIMISRGLIQDAEFLYFLTGSTSIEKPSNPNPNHDIFDEKVWKDISDLGKFEAFSGLVEDISNNTSLWSQWMDSVSSDRDELSSLNLPNNWSSKISFFQQLIILKILTPDKLIPILSQFIEFQLSKEFIEIPQFTLAEPFEDSSPSIPLVFILSTGADPVSDLMTFADQKKMSGSKFLSVSLGQGQGVVAEQFIKNGIESGKWVLLQNCHLAPSWMSRLEELVEELDSNVHPDFRLWLTSMPSKDFPVSILQKSVKLTNEPPTGMKANLLRSYTSFSDEFLSDCSKPVAWRRLLFCLCFYHAQLLERRRFGGVGFNIPYEWNDSDRKVSISHLHLLLEKYEEIPFEAISFLVASIHYGGRVTQALDQRVVDLMFTDLVNANVLLDDHQFAKYGTMTLHEIIHDISNLVFDSPAEVLGLHPNAGVSFSLNETINLCNSLLVLQPRSSSSAGSSEDTTYNIISTILDNLHPLFDAELIAEKYPIKYEESMNSVLNQEVARYNKLLAVMFSTLKELKKALKGVVVLSSALEEMSISISNNQVPSIWDNVAYPSLKPLSSWIEDLSHRLAFIDSWIEGGLPVAFHISSLFFPQGFLTGLLQNYARKHVVSIDQISFSFVIIDKKPEELTCHPEDGCYVYGLYLEGASWSAEENSLIESPPKELFSEFPVIHLLPVVNRTKPETGIYNCPLYKTLTRSGTLSTTGLSTNFVVNIELPTNKPEGHWIKRGTALFCALRS